MAGVPSSFASAVPLALPGSDSYGPSEEGGGALSFCRVGLGAGE